MRTSIATSWFMLLTAASCFAAGNTNEFTLFKHQARRQAYAWRISEARILATPEWRIGSKKIPVSPDKAWQIAQNWFRKQGRGGAGDFVRMEVRLFDLSGHAKSLRGRCFYRIECSPGEFDFMLVVVLMDGTVLEPTGISDLTPEEIK